MTMPHIDWSINIGNIVPIVVGIFIIVSRMARMETKVDAMWHHFLNERRLDREFPDAP